MRYNVRMFEVVKKTKRSAGLFFRSLCELLRTSAPYRRAAIASGVLLAATTALPLWRILPLAGEKPYIPLHYNVYMGVDAFGPWYGVFALPALGAAMLIVNLAFQAVLYRRERVLCVFFAVTTLLTEFVLFAAMILIVLLNL